MASNYTGGVGPPTEETRTVTVHRTDDVPADARVRHFDELTDATQQLLATVEDSGAVVPLGDAREVADGDVIVFTDYYRVDVR